MSNFVSNERYHGERYCPAGWSLQKWGDDLACFKKIAEATASQKNLDQNNVECGKINGKAPLPKDKYEEVSYRMIMIDMNPAKLQAGVDLVKVSAKFVDSDGVDHTHRVNIIGSSHTHVIMNEKGEFHTVPHYTHPVMFCQQRALTTEATGYNWNQQFVN